MTKYAELVQEVNAILDQYNIQMTLRQIYYRLVAKLIIPNTMSRYKALSKTLVKARERGEVDYRRIEDRARTTLGGDYYDYDVDGFKEGAEADFRDAWRNFRMSYWGNQPEYLEVWVEKDALSRICSTIGNKYNVRTCPSRGYSSFTYVMSSVNRLRREEGKEITILYLGDYDPSGLDITRDLQERLNRYGANAYVERLALNIDQINEFNLPPSPAKSTDPRLQTFIYETGSTDTVELDALEPPVLEAIIEQGILRHRDSDLWNTRQAEIRDKRDELKTVFENLDIMW